jgi:uncharacterized protein (DUF433 family)
MIMSSTEEGARAWRFPGIAFRRSAQSRRAWVVDAGMNVWEIIEAFQALGSQERLRRETDISDLDLRLALAYYQQYPEEIEQALTANRVTLGDLVARYPGLISNQ